MEDIEKDLTVQILGDKDLGEMDFETRESLPGWNEEGVDCVYQRRAIRLDKNGDIFKGHRTTEGEWVSIERIEALLAAFKSEGATHVAIQHHCDHNGYVFDYGILRVSTPEDIAKQDLVDEQTKEKQDAARIKYLEKELASLKK
jgi:hypothetical protein